MSAVSTDAATSVQPMDLSRAGLLRYLSRLNPGDDPDAAAPAMNRALVEAGVAVFAIGARARSLEGIYRDASAPAAAAAPAPKPEFV